MYPRLKSGSIDWDAVTLRNNQHAANPAVGDYWQEMFCPVLVVMAVDGDSVTICRKTKPTDPNHWTWDLDKRETVTKKELWDAVHYTHSNTDKCHCDVLPEAHKWVSDFLEETV